METLPDVALPVVGIMGYRLWLWLWTRVKEWGIQAKGSWSLTVTFGR